MIASFPTHEETWSAHSFEHQSQEVLCFLLSSSFFFLLNKLLYCKRSTNHGPTEPLGLQWVIESEWYLHFPSTLLTLSLLMAWLTHTVVHQWWEFITMVLKELRVPLTVWSLDGHEQREPSTLACPAVLWPLGLSLQWKGEGPWGPRAWTSEIT